MGTHALTWTAPTLGGAAAGNYDLVAPGEKTGSITHRPIVVRVSQYSRLVGEPNPAFAIAQGSSGANEGVAPGQTLSDVLGAGAGVSVLAYTADLAGEYSLRPDTPNPNSNYTFTRQNGTLYIGDIRFTVQESNSVLTSREVVCECEGLKPGSEAVFTIYSTPTTLETITVKDDGTCPLTTATIPNSVTDGNHTLELAGEFPSGDPAVQTRAVLLDTPVGGSSSSSSGGSSSSGVSPLTLIDPQPAGLTPARLPFVPQTAPLPASPSSGVTPLSPGVVEAPFGPGKPPRMPGSGALSSWTSESAVRTIEELAREKFTRFQDANSQRVEVLGSRTAARFVVTEATLVDQFALLRAIEASIPRQSADFFSIDSLTLSSQPLQSRSWETDEREGITEFFAAAGLPAPRNIADFDPNDFSEWLLVQTRSTTYLPGTEVFLVLTSEPVVLGSAIVDRDGNALVSGTIPVELLSAGEHRIRLVGIRDLEGAYLDDEGILQLSPDLISEIQRFDLGTQATIAIIGEKANNSGHVALRVVPLIPKAPWWTLWFLLGVAVIGVVVRMVPRGPLKLRRWGSVALALGAALPGVILGWLSTVTVVAWWALGLGVMATLVAALGPYRRESATVSREPERLRV